jgi:hypothetical protein
MQPSTPARRDRILENKTWMELNVVAWNVRGLNSERKQKYI